MGLVTIVDLNGERPMKYMQEVGAKREDVFLRDIMTTRQHLDVLHFDEVERSHVGDIIETMKVSNRQHALVVDKNDAIRGIFSTKTICNQLGLDFIAKDQKEVFKMLENLLH
jgi:predicted transcriptional regulator